MKSEGRSSERRGSCGAPGARPGKSNFSLERSSCATHPSEVVVAVERVAVRGLPPLSSCCSGWTHGVDRLHGGADCAHCPVRLHRRAALSTSSRDLRTTASRVAVDRRRAIFRAGFQVDGNCALIAVA